MKVEIMFFDGCPSHEATVELVEKTIERLGVEASVEEIDVPTDEEAERLRFLGSPSVRVDGEDIEPGAAESTSIGRRCRVYANSDGLSGVPPVEMVEAALTGETYDAGTSHDIEATKPDCCSSNQRASVQLLVADWCPQCPAAKQFWEQLQSDEEFDLEVIDIESERGSELAQQHGVRAVPATVIDDALRFPGTPLPGRQAAIDALGR